MSLRNVSYVLMVLAVVASLLAVVLMGESGWPGLHHDGALYITPAVNSSIGKGHTIAVYSTALLRMNPEDLSFRGHGQLYQFVLSALLAGGDMENLMPAIATINAITLPVCGLYFFAGCSYQLRLGPLATAAVVTLGVWGTAAVLLWLQGRPEQLLPLILASAGLARNMTSVVWVQDLISALELALIGATSPLPGLIAAGCRLLVMALEHGALSRFALRAVLLAATAAACWYGIIWIVYPFDPLELFFNTASGRNLSVGPRALRYLPHYWLWAPSLPLIGLPFAVLITQGVGSFFCNAYPWFQRAVIVLLALICARWVANAGVYLPGLYYNLVGFYPAVLMAALHGLLRARPAPLPAQAGKALGVVLVVGMIGVSLGFVREVLLLGWYRNCGVTLQEARQITAHLFDDANSDDRIAIPSASHRPSLVVLDDSNWRLLTLPDDYDLDSVGKIEKHLNVHVVALLLPQADVLSQPPRTLDSWQLCQNNWIWQKPTLLGFDLDAKMPGYQFAVYRRKSQ